MKKAHYISITTLAIVAGSGYLFWTTSCKKESSPPSAMEQVDEGVNATTKSTQDAADAIRDTQK